jgi:hypothetical protein
MVFENLIGILYSLKGKLYYIPYNHGRYNMYKLQKELLLNVSLSKDTFNKLPSLANEVIQAKQKLVEYLCDTIIDLQDKGLTKEEEIKLIKIINNYLNRNCKLVTMFNL